MSVAKCGIGATSSPARAPRVARGPGWQPVATAEVDDRVRAAAGEHTLPRSVGVIRTSSQAPAAGSPRHQRGNDGVSLWCPEHGTEADTRSN